MEAQIRDENLLLLLDMIYKQVAGLRKRMGKQNKPTKSICYGFALRLDSINSTKRERDLLRMTY